MGENLSGGKMSASSDTVTRQFAGAHGIQLVGDIGGAASALPIILTHGAGQTRHSWRNAGTVLRAQGYRTVSMDARGHGESAWDPEKRYESEDNRDDLMAVIREVGGAPALVGASMGGLSSLAVAASAPEMVSALVLVDVTPRINPDGARRVGAFMAANPDGFASLDEAADAIASYLPHRPRPKDNSGLGNNLVKGPNGRYRWHWDPAFIERRPEDHDLERFLEGQAEKFRGYASAVKVPTLLVRGSKSEIVDDAAAEEFARLMPHAEQVNLQGAHHMVAGDDNDAFSNVVIDFLRRVYPAKR